MTTSTILQNRNNLARSLPVNTIKSPSRWMFFFLWNVLLDSSIFLNYMLPVGKGASEGPNFKTAHETTT